MSILSVVPCCLVLGSVALAIPVGDEPAVRFAETVEDVETLRVLLTKELRGDAAIAGFSNSRWMRSDSQAHGAWRYIFSRGEDEDSGSTASDDDDRNTEGESAAQIETAEGYRILADPDVYALSGYFGDGGITSYTRAFYAPGVGAWIDTSVRVPMVLSRGEKNEKDVGDPANDAWAEAKRSLRGESADPNDDGVTAVVIEYRLSDDVIEKVVAGAKNVLYQHGARIRHLGRDESVVIALKIEGDTPTPANAALSGWFSTARSHVGRGATLVTEGTKTKTVILRVPKQAFDRQADGELDEAAFRQMIRVTEY